MTSSVLNRFRSVITGVLFLCAVNCVSSTYAQSNELPALKIDRLANELLSQSQLTGINILLIKDGKTIYNKAFGYADAGKKVPLQTDHIFRIASQTKAITSLAAMMLWEEGKFLLDDPVSKYIPEFRSPRVLDKFNASDSSYTTIPASGEITIRDLFRHTSGISYPVFSAYPALNAIYAKAHIATGIGSTGNLKENITLLAKQPLAHHPGEAFTYGLNTDVLGYLVEIWSGMSLDEFFRERIFGPLEMNDTYFLIPPQKAGRLIPAYERKDNGLVKVGHTIYEGNSVDYPLQQNVYFSGGAGLSSTMADYSKFLELILNKGVFRGKRLLGSRTIELMLQDQLNDRIKSHGTPDLSFGLGFALVTPENKYLHSKSVGSIYWGGAFNTHYWVDPKERLIGLVYTQEYMPQSYWDLGTRFQNVIYSLIQDK